MVKEPNKYAKNAKLKPNSKASTYKAFITFALMILALVGIAADLFKGEVFFNTIKDKVVNEPKVLLALPIVIVIAWFLNKILSSPMKQEKSNDLPMYILVVIGLYYAARLFINGGF